MAKAFDQKKRGSQSLHMMNLRHDLHDSSNRDWLRARRAIFLLSKTRLMRI